MSMRFFARHEDCEKDGLNIQEMVSIAFIYNGMQIVALM